ncbi:hypothetical protein KS4_17150 [Poriferisphaera corsica]|uniref:Lipoprotein n=1 Tax=Poriferisphaera corsica TaxID=2528020 RepID=A0A517YTY2_9BACT|nr:hypothetical protein [Poriferisphaera corsica]QDU33659.1 hypothetical protein KS4_17150 [Poriferisphaera corsica]
MRKTLIMLSSLALSGLTIVGCDQQAAQTATAQENLDKAIAQINVADNSYDPNKSVGIPFDEFRNIELAKALKDLSKVQKDGADYQVVAASQLKADILLSNARFELDSAKKLFAKIGPKAASLLRYVVAVDDAESTVKDIDTSIDVSPIVNTASAEIKIQQQRISQLAIAAKEVQSKLNAIDKKKQAYLDNSQTHFANARELKNKAFKVTGDMAYKLEAEASAELRKANEASAESDKLTAAAERLQVALSLNATETQAATNVVNELNAGKEAAKVASNASKQNLEDAVRQRDDLYESFRQEFNKITTDYAQDVNKGFDAAIESATASIAALQQASSKASSSSRAQVQNDLLIAYCALANILSEQASAAASFAENIAVIIDNNNGSNTSISSEELAFVREIYNNISNKQVQILKDAEQAIQDAREQFASVTSDNAGQYDAEIKSYEVRIENAVLQ